MRLRTPEDVGEICDLLDRSYGRPDLGNHRDPLDELIFILLSTMTTEANYRRAYAALRAEFATWEQVMTAPRDEVRAAISGGGLSETKAGRIQALLVRLQHDWGSLELGFMHSWPTEDLQYYLTTLPGIGYKAAACVLAYSFGRDVCPEDTHTYRTAVRLGVVAVNSAWLGRTAHLALHEALPSGRRLEFHVNAVAHGRQRCGLARPRCDECPLRAFCVAPEAGRYSRRQLTH